VLFSERRAARRVPADVAADGITEGKVKLPRSHCCRTSKGRPRRTIPIVVLLAAIPVFAQSPPASPGRPWHTGDEQQITNYGKRLRQPLIPIEPDKAYTLVELIDLAEAHNPETRVAWENARAQAAALGIARSELYPLLSAAALSGVDRAEIPLGTQFYRFTIPSSELSLDLNYTILDFGARRGRIAAESARVLATNFEFNDVHRKLIFQVQEAYYRLLNASAQDTAARASLANAEAVQQAAEDRLSNGLATLPDVLEARSATAQSQYDLQAVLGAEQIARGDLATALGAPAATMIRVEPLSEVPTPESIGDTVKQVIYRALDQRPDLQAQVADIRLGEAQRQEARAAYYPSLNFKANANAQSLYFQQQTLPWGHTADLTGGMALSLNWTVFDGGARRNRLMQAEAEIRKAESQVNAARDSIEDEVWTAYSNLNTAFRQREAATALLNSATESYAASLESYNYGVRNELDVTAAQKLLAQARSADILARTQVLVTLADLAFRSGDSIQSNASQSKTRSQRP
jgi:outer membrane protein